MLVGRDVRFPERFGIPRKRCELHGAQCTAIPDGRNLGFAVCFAFLERDANTMARPYVGLATIEFLHAQNGMQTLANPNGEQSTVHQCNSGSATPRLCIQRNPRATCEPVVAHTHSGLAKPMFAVAEDGHPMVHTQSGLAKPTLAGSERNADPMLHTHSGLAKPRSCSPSRKCEPHGVHTHSRRNR
jgi:hypothetical protein